MASFSTDGSSISPATPLTLKQQCLQLILSPTGDLTAEDKQAVLDVLFKQTTPGCSGDFIHLSSSIRRTGESEPFPSSCLRTGHRFFVDYQTMLNRIKQDLAVFTKSHPCKRFCIVSRVPDWTEPWLFPPESVGTVPVYSMVSDRPITIDIYPNHLQLDIRPFDSSQIRVIVDVAAKRQASGKHDDVAIMFELEGSCEQDTVVYIYYTWST